jgi:hypothetical protein
MQFAESSKEREIASYEDFCAEFCSQIESKCRSAGVHMVATALSKS